MSVLSNTGIRMGASGAGGGDAGYQVANSLRFNDDDLAYLNKTFAAGNRKTWTWSGWVKRGNIDINYPIIFGSFNDASNYFFLRFNQTSDALELRDRNDGTNNLELTTNAVFRDSSAFYSIVLAVDTTQATNSNRAKLYINGEQVTSFSGSIYPAQDFETQVNLVEQHCIGSSTPVSTQYFDGLMADVHFVDGQALDASSFGETDATTGQWVPKEYTHVTATDDYHVINDGTTWSDETESGFTYWDGPTGIFDGDLSTRGGRTSNAYHTLVDSATISASSGIRIYWNQVDPGQRYIRINDTTELDDGSAGLYPGWSSVSSFSGTINKIEVKTAASSSWAIAAVEVDGIILTDDATDNSFYLKFDNTSDLGEDSSGNDNDWTANNLHGVDTTYGYSMNYNHSLDMYVPAGWEITDDETDVLVDDQKGIIIDQSGTWHFAIVPNTTTITMKYITYDGSAGGPTVSLNTAEDWNGTSIHPTSSTGNGSTSTPSVSTYSVTSGTTYYVRTGLTGSGNPAIVVYGTGFDFGVLSTHGKDVLADSPSTYDDGGNGVGNYATLNPLKTEGLGTFSNGNLEFTQTTNGNETIISTMSLSGGSWYWEVTPNSSTNNTPGIAPITTTNWPGGGDGFGWELQAGCTNINGSRSCGQPTATTGDVIGFAYNSSTYQLRIYKNDTEVSFSPVTVTSGVEYFAAFGTTSSGGAAATFNFGQRAFEYTPPTGYKALNTYNLDDPTIADPNEHFDVSIWSGNTTQDRKITTAFSPDLVWVKRRSGIKNHNLFDKLRGDDNYLNSNEDNPNQVQADLLGLVSDGYELGDVESVNLSGSTYVGWAWDAGSSTVSNTDGTITSSVRANPSAGFSIVEATISSAGTVGHGLNAKPSMVIRKRTDSTGDWYVAFDAGSAEGYLLLNDTDAITSQSQNLTSTTFDAAWLGNSNETWINYCFSEVEGYSKFGSYEGNNSTDGPFVWCGFKPRWVMVKSTAANSGNWWIWDSEREPTNAITLPLYANTSAAETSSGTGAHDLLSNGFKFRSNGGAYNAAYTYIFCAFAESPFKYSNAR